MYTKLSKLQHLIALLTTGNNAPVALSNVTILSAYNVEDVNETKIEDIEK